MNYITNWIFIILNGLVWLITTRETVKELTKEKPDKTSLFIDFIMMMFFNAAFWIHLSRF